MTSKLVFPKNQKVHLRVVPPGPKSQELRRREDAHLAPGAQAYALMAGIAVDHALGSTITDVDGNTYLDLIGGIGVNALGHSHPKVVEPRSSRASDEAASRSALSPHSARVELLERLASHAPRRAWT